MQIRGTGESFPRRLDASAGRIITRLCLQIFRWARLVCNIVLPQFFKLSNNKRSLPLSALWLLLVVDEPVLTAEFG